MDAGDQQRTTEGEEVNPGSDEAIDAGCRCPCLDNGHGRGYLGGVKGDDGNTVFIVSSECPLHGEQAKREISANV